MADSLQASAAGLALVDRARQRCGWTKTSTARWWQDAHTSRATLRRFWQQERIQREIFIALCATVGIQDWGAVASLPDAIDPPTEPDDFRAPTSVLDLDEAPDLESFYGRDRELAQLEQWIGQEKCKLVTVLGMGGIGKTALVLAFIDRLTGSTPAPFESVIWRSLHAAPSLLTLLDRLLYRLTAHSTAEAAQTIPQATALLLHYLRQHRCLLVLDGLEALLQPADLPNPDRSIEQEYGEFWQRLSRDRHQSCILLTSREPAADSASHPSVQTLTLKGLPDSDALTLLRSIKFTGKEREIKAFVRLYGGNPLALKVMAPTLQAWLGRDLVTYLSHTMPLMGDRLRILLRQQIDKLSALEREIIDWLAIWQEPIGLSRLQTHLLCSPGLGAILGSIASLEGRSLLEKHFYDDELLLTLQPLVMQAVSDDLVEQAVQEIVRVIDSRDIRHLRLLRTHCLLRPGTDNLAGDRILTQLADRLRHSLSMPLPQAISQIFPVLNQQSPLTVGYAHYNLLALRSKT